MKFKELLTVLDSNAYLNIISDKGTCYMKARLFLLHLIYLKEELDL